ncbi:MAG: XdhC/CoxI family protein [Bacillota bacterium]|nr:XdhC/CoxI family protein [Bacillota bacterium]
MSLYHLIDNLLASGKKTALLTVLGSDKDDDLAGRKLVLSDSGIAYNEFDQDFAEILQKTVAPQFESGTSSVVEIHTENRGSLNLFFHIYSIPPRLIIFGGGHVGAALSRIASHLDFEVTVADDRPAFASQSVHPEADHLICDSFENAFEKIKPLPSDYLVIVTRGHKHDRCCLEQALSVNTAYVGMIGSRHRVKTQLAELAEAGYTAEQLSHVHSPIGLKIGAVTEAEIAISILAEIIQVMRSGSREENIQVEVLQALKTLEKEKSPAVLATIVKTLGSTPRKTGSQMIIYPDGSIKGTIGGGCTEADVRREALTCLDLGITEKIRFNLTADAAADEGMACGGTMDIYLELINQPE